MPQDNLTEQLIADLRVRLLDLRNGNKLLNYKHSERSKTQVRIVDEQPDYLHECLISGKSLSFRSLPEPGSEFPDEKNPDFLMALEEARRLDSGWVSLMEEDEDITSNKAMKLDREIRDRVRAELGLTPAKSGRLTSIADWARLNDIEPSFDLPSPTVISEDKHTDNEIQTLLLPDDMQGKLAGILDNAKTAQQEMGVNLLHVAIGFLEWVETSQAEKTMIAPLLLYPVELDRKPMKDKGQYRYFLRGDSDPIINFTLRQRLDQDYNLIVPELEENDTAESYMAKLANVIGDMPRWKIRRFSTLGLFSFSRLVMYNDLDPKHWVAAGGLSGSGVLGELFGRREAGNPSADTYDVEDPVIEAEVPLLIRDADSSQHQAIIDVMRGKNLVIKGPPGTGKSQTIANIIAAALAKRQHVLFIAEKAAALDVVKKRLDEAGLGEFCFELHSTKAKKTEVLASLDRRLNVNSERSSTSIQAALDELHSLRDRLTQHSVTMNQPFSVLEFSDRGAWRKATIHDILWAEQRTRNIAPRFAAIDRIVFADAADTSRFDLERRHNRLTTISRLVTEIIEKFGALDAHPWAFATSPNIQFFDVPEIIGACEELSAALDLLDGTMLPIAIQGISIPDNLKTLEEFAQHLMSLPLLEAGAPEDLVRFFLEHPESEAAGLDFVSELEAYAHTRNKRDHHLPSGTTTLTAELAASLASLAKALGVATLTFEQLSQKAADAQRELAQLSKVVELSKSLLDIIGIRCAPTPHHLRLALKVTETVAQADRATLLGRLPSIIEETAYGVLEHAKADATKLSNKYAELREHFIFSAGISVPDLRRHASVLKTTGMLGKLGGEFKVAKKTTVAMLKKTGTFNPLKSAEMLLELADHIEERLAFENDPLLRSVCQQRFRGIDTEFDALLSANRFSTDVRTNFAGLDTTMASARRFLLQSDLETLDGLKALAADDRYQELCKVLDEITDADADLAERHLQLEQFSSEIEKLSNALLATELRNDTTPAQIEEIVKLAKHVEQLEANIIAFPAAAFLGKVWDGPKTNPQVLRIALDSARALRLHTTNHGLREVILAQPQISEAVQQLRVQGEEIEKQTSRAIMQLTALLQRVIDDNLVEAEASRLSAQPKANLTAKLTRAIAMRDELMHWTMLRRGIVDAKNDGLLPLFAAYDEMGEPYLEMVEAYDRVLYRSLARLAVELHPELGKIHALSLDDIRCRFQDLDKRIMDMRRLELISSLSSTRIPQGIQSPKKGECTEAALVRNEIAKKKKHIPLRDLIERASNAIRAMKPCAMMSPSSVAQFIKPDQRFDLVIIDEASQMRPEEAISAMARAKQVVVVGDPQQLPPSSFFDRQEGEQGDDDEIEKVAAESILDVARTAFQPSRELLWHYRSKHGSLIAFSNRHFYDDRLFVFPSPQEGHPDHGVKLIPVAGQYRASVNVPEINAIVLAASEFMEKNPDKSLGIVALNQPQRDLILAGMDRLFVSSTIAERYRARWAKTLEPFFVKNLENVQGDERDVIFISTVYGPDEAGNLMQRFGPINGAAGDRRLNVLFSRAKHGVNVFSSMRPDQIRTDANTPRGTRLLKDYLTFAATGQLDVGTRTYQECDSDFERFVKECLEAKGYEVVAQVGVAGFRIDLGISHPEWPFGFLLGIECDGAAYHSSLSARDRDRLRQQILESLGWTIYRIWSTDWFRDQAREMEKMLAFIDQTLRACQTRRADELAKHEARVKAQQVEPETEDLSSPFEEPTADSDEEGEPEILELAEPANVFEFKAVSPALSAAPAKTFLAKGELGTFKEAQYDDLGLQLSPNRFFDADYKDTLAKLIERCISIEAPIRDDVLARRIGRLHGFLKAGSRIREHVSSIAAKSYQSTKDVADLYFWPAGIDPESWITFRRPSSNEARPTDEIAIEELRALALIAQEQGSIVGEDPLVIMTRLAGLQRLRAPSRERFTVAIKLAHSYVPHSISADSKVIP